MTGKECRAIIASDAAARSVMEIADDMDASIMRMINLQEERFPSHWTAKEKYEAAIHTLGFDQ